VEFWIFFICLALITSGTLTTGKNQHASKQPSQEVFTPAKTEVVFFKLGKLSSDSQVRILSSEKAFFICFPRTPSIPICLAFMDTYGPDPWDS